jgi:hypothetical protein
MGIIWLIIGVPLGFSSKNYGFLLLGLIFTIVGLANKKKWKENHRTWKQLTKEERRIKTFLIVVLGIFFVAGLLVYLINR